MSDFDARVDRLVNSIVKNQQEYLDEVAEYAADGYRHNFCFHGVNQWVDYDCACGLCEDGAINEYSSLKEVREYAIEEVNAEIREEELMEEKKFKIIDLFMSGPQKMSLSQALKAYDKVMSQ